MKVNYKVVGYRPDFFRGDAAPTNLIRRMGAAV